MTDSVQVRPQRAPVHFWIIAVVSLLWNLIGGYDYLMTQTENVDYMKKFTPEQLTYFYGFPAWVVSTWAIAVWGGVLGSVLMLLRHRAAVVVFLLALMAMVVTSFHNFFLSNGMEMMGGIGPILFTVVIFMVSLALFLYSRAMQQQGVLR